MTTSRRDLFRLVLGGAAAGVAAKVLPAPPASEPAQARVTPERLRHRDTPIPKGGWQRWSAERERWEPCAAYDAEWLYVPQVAEEWSAIGLMPIAPGEKLELGQVVWMREDGYATGEPAAVVMGVYAGDHGDGQVRVQMRGTLPPPLVPWDAPKGEPWRK